MRQVVGILLVLLAAFGLAQASPPKRVILGVGGKTAVVYLPLTVVERLGFFKEEGLDVVIQDLQAGSRALQALIGGSVEVTMGFYDHTIQMQAQERDIVAFVEVGRYPAIVLAVRSDLAGEVRGMADLKGRKVGVSAPGSSTHFFLNYLLVKNGLKPQDVSAIGIGAGAQVVAAVQNKQVDAISNVEPAITFLEERGLIKVLADTRSAAGARAVLGGSTRPRSSTPPGPGWRETPTPPRSWSTPWCGAFGGCRARAPRRSLRSSPRSTFWGIRPFTSRCSRTPWAPFLPPAASATPPP